MKKSASYGNFKRPQSQKASTELVTIEENENESPEVPNFSQFEFTQEELEILKEAFTLLTDEKHSISLYELTIRIEKCPQNFQDDQMVLSLLRRTFEKDYLKGAFDEMPDF